MNQTPQVILDELKNMKTEITRFMMAYKFAVAEMDTKINILRDEFAYIHDYNPIEHTSSRVKSPESIFKKAFRKNIDLSLESIEKEIHDIAGIRITCSFRSDIHRVANMLMGQQDIVVIEVKDYMKHPKPNGYQSLHLILKVPVFMSDRVNHVFVEVQIRTIAMDFWASLEHKIYYKYDKAVPERLTDELREAAISAAELDQKMEALHEEVKELKEHDAKASTIEETLEHSLQKLIQNHQSPKS